MKESKMVRAMCLYYNMVKTAGNLSSVKQTQAKEIGIRFLNSQVTPPEGTQRTLTFSKEDYYLLFADNTFTIKS